MASDNLIFAGDLVLDEPDPDHWLSGIAPATRAADAAIGHLEVPHTARGIELEGDVPAPGAAPEHLSALKNAGFHAVTLAGNHMADRGAEGIADTRAELARLQIACCGAGANLELARQPAILQIRGRRLALLSYNCVGPESSWASPDRAGCAYVRIDTRDGGTVTPTAELLAPDAESLAAMQRDIEAAAAHDFVAVALHKGVVHKPAKLAPYERAVSQAAIEAGADVVLGHHAHLIRGIEWYRGKPIFHGLGNGCVVTRALSPAQDHPARAAWAQRRRQMFGFEPDPDYWLAPFHPEAVNAMLARIRWHDDGGIEAGFVPVYVEPPGRPVLAGGEQAAAVTAYVARITAEAGLPPVSFSIRADMVVVS
jgi:poly-gamma-glutamate capsule biosynthesis protein CapA/YwtB (metallophosphatase superfamily)